jgi:homocysteine S-methyltransferase
MTARSEPAGEVRGSEFLRTLENAKVILTEGSMYERLRRLPGARFDPALAQAAMVFDPPSRLVLEQAHREYLDIARAHGLPMVALADTWRANRERIERSPFAGEDVNGACVRLLAELRDELGSAAAPVFVGGMLGPKGDAYTPAEAPPTDEAESFHSYQVEKLAEADVDFLKASTLPSVAEAIGLARAMSRTAFPYLLSFVIRPDGTVLDGTPLWQAFDQIDQAVATPPAGYYVNCIHPTILLAALETLTPGQDESSREHDDHLRRLVGFHANTSAKSPEELDDMEEIAAEDDPRAFGAMMREVHDRYRIKILGGCCGSGTEHIKCLAEAITPAADAD